MARKVKPKQSNVNNSKTINLPCIGQVSLQKPSPKRKKQNKIHTPNKNRRVISMIEILAIIDTIPNGDGEQLLMFREKRRGTRRIVKQST